MFYKQLLAWILKGSLHDPFQEFIIEEVTETKVESEQQGDKTTHPPSAVHSFVSTNSSEESGLTNLQKIGSSGVIGLRKFQLRVDRIPSHISVAIAEKIFFIGESIQLFENETGDKSAPALYRRDVLEDQEDHLYAKLVRDRNFLLDQPIH